MAIAETINSPQESGQGTGSRSNAAVIQRDWFRLWNRFAGLDRANEYRHRMEAVRHSIGVINEDACKGSRDGSIAILRLDNSERVLRFAGRQQSSNTRASKAWHILR